MSGPAATALDLDGTLLASDGSLSIASIRTLRELSERDYRIVYVTARHLEAARLVSDQINVPADVACCLGAALYELPTGRLVREWPLDVESARTIARRLAASLPQTSFGWVEQGQAHVQANYPNPFGSARIETTSDRLPSRPVTKLFARNTTASPDGFREAAAEAATGCAALMPTAPGLVEFVVPGVDKGTALREWCSFRNTAPERVVAFGDSRPDVPLLTTAGLGLAVGNAAPEVREAADGVVGSNDSDGVASALRDLFHLASDDVPFPRGHAAARPDPRVTARRNTSKGISMSEQWDDNFMNALRESLPDGESLGDIDADASLADLGLDSVSMISLMMRLEGDYEISFPDEAVSFSTFDTPVVLWSTVCALRVSEARS